MQITNLWTPPCINGYLKCNIYKPVLQYFSSDYSTQVTSPVVRLPLTHSLQDYRGNLQETNCIVLYFPTVQILKGKCIYLGMNSEFSICILLDQCEQLIDKNLHLSFSFHVLLQSIIFMRISVIISLFKMKRFLNMSHTSSLRPCSWDR